MTIFTFAVVSWPLLSNAVNALSMPHLLKQKKSATLLLAHSETSKIGELGAWTDVTLQELQLQAKLHDSVHGSQGRRASIQRQTLKEGAVSDLKTDFADKLWKLSWWCKQAPAELQNECDKVAEWKVDLTWGSLDQNPASQGKNYPTPNEFREFYDKFTDAHKTWIGTKSKREPPPGRWWLNLSGSNDWP